MRIAVRDASRLYFHGTKGDLFIWSLKITTSSSFRHRDSVLDGLLRPKRLKTVADDLTFSEGKLTRRNFDYSRHSWLDCGALARAWKARK